MTCSTKFSLANGRHTSEIKSCISQIPSSRILTTAMELLQAGAASGPRSTFLPRSPGLRKACPSSRVALNPIEPGARWSAALPLPEDRARTQPALRYRAHGCTGPGPSVRVLASKMILPFTRRKGQRAKPCHVPQLFPGRDSSGTARAKRTARPHSLGPAPRSDRAARPLLAPTSPG